MEPAPPLLETYEEAHMLLEAKGWRRRGWGLAKAAEYLSKLPGLAALHLSEASLSKKATPGANNPIEPEIAVAVEGLETRVGYERQTEIVTAGLRAVHGDPPPPEARSTRVSRFIQKLGRAFWARVAVTAASGALVGCLALVALAPFLPRQADAAFQPGPLVVVVPDAMADGSPAWFEPGALLALSDPGGPKRPAEQQIPVKTLPGQKVAPCDAGLRQEAIHGNCWAWMGGAPPCGRLFRHGDKCYAPVAAEPKKPAELAP